MLLSKKVNNDVSKDSPIVKRASAEFRALRIARELILMGHEICLGVGCA